MRYTWSFAVVVMIALAPACRADVDTDFSPVQWTITRSDEGPAMVQLSIGYTSRSGTFGWRRGAMPLVRLQGLEVADVSSDAVRPVRFTIPQDPGTLTCDGTVRMHRGSGDCVFVADADYAAELERRGIGHPSLRDQFVLAVHEAELAFVDELQRQGYATPTVEELVRASLNGADLTMLRELGAVGYRTGTLARLISLRTHSVTASYIRELRDAGLRELTGRDLIRLHSSKITGDAVRSFVALHGSAPSVDELVRRAAKER